MPEQAPWLALMVFRAGELPDAPESLGQTTTRTVAELRSPGDGILGPDLSDTGITPGIAASRCQSIDVPAALFTALVPREEELNYLAHVRDVSTRPQRRDDGEILTKGQYAVLAANRLPRQPGTYTAHLVSLEGFNGKLNPGQLGGNVRSVRLCVLHSWTFTSDPAGTRDAAALLSNLVAPARADRENLTLRLRPSGSVAARSTADAEQYARRRLHLGYTPLPYRLLSGETTYGWYRGPLVPVMAAETRDFARDTPKTTADHALIYEQEHGLFDVSYAAAWTLGRTLALSDPDYSEEITRARRELANTAATMMALATAGPGLAAADPADLDGRTLRELAAPGFATDLLDALARPLAPHDQAPASASARRSRRACLTQQSARAVLAAGPQTAALQATAERHTRTLPAWAGRAHPAAPSAVQLPGAAPRDAPPGVDPAFPHRRELDRGTARRRTRRRRPHVPGRTRRHDAHRRHRQPPHPYPHRGNRPGRAAGPLRTRRSMAGVRHPHQRRRSEPRRTAPRPPRPGHTAAAPGRHAGRDRHPRAWPRDPLRHRQQRRRRRRRQCPQPARAPARRRPRLPAAPRQSWNCPKSWSSSAPPGRATTAPPTPSSP
ncbi:hypothetical protein ACFCVY_25830 [Streptomyces sp. NPDC056411]|uniref:hypothetical protein n=1 Tax=Streptomyces sp. NPDC056411 TaxID=3345813 RepID=UPI0035DCFA92